MNEDITPFNDKGEAHGYWEQYWRNELGYKRFYINGKVNGYEEYYPFSNSNKLILIFNL